MRFQLFVPLLLIVACSKFNAETITPAELQDEINRIELLQDLNKKATAAEQLYTKLMRAGRIPYTQDSTAVFIYFGVAKSVAWNGDFNRWGENRSTTVSAKNIEGTHFWYDTKIFPADARLDYKVTLNNAEWILDPGNPYQQWSGFGPNSELRMPGWQPDAHTNAYPDVAKGSMSEWTAINSGKLGYAVNYAVYQPAGFDEISNMNVIYVTDGQEYSADELGAMVNVLDNLHNTEEIEPTVAVFVNPIDPGDGESNRRMTEMGSPEYLLFFTEELIPVIENKYSISGDSENRAILGTSLGGLNATFFGFSRPDLFKKIGIQAPAFWYRKEIYNLVKTTEFPDPKIFMTVGTIGDNIKDARLMKTIFEEKGYDFEYLEVNEGHSWGAWRTQLDEILIYFFGKR